jgi:hypothetical protein
MAAESKAKNHRQQLLYNKTQALSVEALQRELYER